MITCPACGGQNPEGSATCQNCGSSLLPGGPTQTPYTASSMPEPPQAAPPPSAFDPFGVNNPPAPSPYASYENPPQPPAPSPYPTGYTQAYGSPALKDRTLALVLEILPALFGVFGIGRLYSGDTTTGVIWLIGGLVWAGIQVLIAVFTAGIGCFCTIPINLVAVGLAGYLLNNFIKQHPETFKAY